MRSVGVYRPIIDMRSVRVHRPIIHMRSVRVYRLIIDMRSVRAFRRTDMHMHGDKTIGRRNRTFTFDGNRCENNLSLVQLPHSKTGGNFSRDRIYSKWQGILTGGITSSALSKYLIFESVYSVFDNYFRKPLLEALQISGVPTLLSYCCCCSVISEQNIST